jgi:hypothetical protein
MFDNIESTTSTNGSTFWRAYGPTQDFFGGFTPANHFYYTNTYWYSKHGEQRAEANSLIGPYALLHTRSKA